jgi:hypothetical protein
MLLKYAESSSNAARERVAEINDISFSQRPIGIATYTGWGISISQLLNSKQPIQPHLYRHLVPCSFSQSMNNILPFDLGNVQHLRQLQTKNDRKFISNMAVVGSITSLGYLTCYLSQRALLNNKQYPGISPS